MDFGKAAMRAGVVLVGLIGLAACSTFPDAPRYSTRAEPAAPYSAATVAPPVISSPPPSGEGVRGATDPAREVAPPATAPTAEIEGGSLDSYYGAESTPAPAPATPAPTYSPAPMSAPATAATPVTAGARYVIQPGDTLSGVGRRFQTPVQTLIDLNGLGPRGSISAGQALTLPSTAVDIGGDPYATGPAPGVSVAASGAIPPPPPPPSGNRATPPPSRQPAATAAPTGSTASSVSLAWPIRGDIVRRFGPVGMGERNNGVNIAAPEGDPVRASAAGTVGYVGDDLAAQGLTVLVVHRDGWRTVYGHLGSTTVRDGDAITAGQQIGTVGTTAGDGRPSIHYETWRMSGDEPRAVDPLTVLPR